MEISFSPRNNSEFSFFLWDQSYHGLWFLLQLEYSFKSSHRSRARFTPCGQNTLGRWSLEIFVGWVLIAIDLHVSHVLLLRGGCCVHLDESLETNIVWKLPPSYPKWSICKADPTLIKFTFNLIRRKINLLFLVCKTKNRNWTLVLDFGWLSLWTVGMTQGYWTTQYHSDTLGYLCWYLSQTLLKLSVLVVVLEILESPKMYLPILALSLIRDLGRGLE